MSDNPTPTDTGRDPVTEPPPSAPPPRGPALRTIAVVVALTVAVFWVGSVVGTRVGEVVSDMVRSLASIDGASEEGDGGFYSCGMHPWIILPRPGPCPVCQMDLTPIDPAKFTGDVAIDPRIVQNIGVRIARVETGPLVRTIRTVGTVDYDETTVRDVNIKVSGWIETLHVDYLGAEVRKGEPLFEFFSRELYETQKQYLIALRSHAQQTDVPFVPRAAQDPEVLLESSRIRLEYYDITPQQIAELEERGAPSKTMTITSPYDGVVISKHANEGMLVDPGMLAYRIADLSKVWVLVTLYEYQIPYVEVGQEARMTLSYIPGQSFDGKVIYIYPFLDRKAREVQVRLEFDNPGGFLKPGMYANIELKNVLARERVLAPLAAIIDTGERRVAFASLGDGKFEPRDVRTGIHTEGDKVEILDGLKPGEMVVTSGQFLLDSEAKIREALGKMIRGELASEQHGSATASGGSELTSLPPGVATGLTQTLDAYLEIQDRLASDTADGIDEPARALARSIDSALTTPIPEDEHFWHKHTEVATVRARALELVGQKELPAAREKFAELSVALAELLTATGVPRSYGAEVQELRCPMYREGQGGSVWLQRPGEVRNPYFGAMMLRCFEERKALPFTGRAAKLEGEPAKAPEPTAAPAEAPEDGAATEPVDPPPAEHEHGEGDAAQATEAAQPSIGERLPDAATPPVGPTIARLVNAYVDLSESLAGDSDAETPRLAKELGEAAAALEASAAASVEARSFAHRVREDLTALSGATDIATTRAAFGKLSVSLIALASSKEAAGATATLFEAYCPMAKASWLQRDKTVSNPYYGASMLRCGSITREIGGAPAEEK